MIGYGLSRKKHLLEMIEDVCEFLSPATKRKAIPMLIGTACAETGLGTTPDTYEKEGRGAYQFDSIRYKEIQEYICYKRPDLLQSIKEEYGIDFRMIAFGPILDNSPLVCTLACRIGYMMKPDAFPAEDDLPNQARYWKRFWNSEAGKGTPEHYKKSWFSHYINAKDIY